MSIDDVYFLKENSFKQNYVFHTDSADRDMLIYPHPNEYVIEFTQPFRNVIGLEVVDASIPRTMYAIDKYNNTLYFKATDVEIDWDSNVVFDMIILDPGDYDINQMIQKLNSILLDYAIEIKTVSNPPELTNKIFFESSKPFILDMNNSTMRTTLGFNLTQNQGNGHRIIERIKTDPQGYRYFHSYFDGNSHKIYAPGIVDLIGEKYVILDCKEIVDHSTTSLAYSKHSLGLAKFRLGVLGYNEQDTHINRTQWREFHPIGKLPQITLQFNTARGNLYDFKGVDHTIIFNIHYLQPANNDKKEFKSPLNPTYNPNMLEYLQTLDEQDQESEDEDEELSTDNTSLYKINEAKYLELLRNNRLH